MECARILLKGPWKGARGAGVNRQGQTELRVPVVPGESHFHTFGVKEIERQPWPKNRGAAPDSLTSIGRLYGRKGW